MTEKKAMQLRWSAFHHQELLNGQVFLLLNVSWFAEMGWAAGADRAFHEGTAQQAGRLNNGKLRAGALPLVYDGIGLRSGR